MCSVVSDSFVTPWTVATSLLCPRDFPGKNTGVGCHFPSPGDLPNPGIKPRSPAFQADTLTSEPPGCNFINKRMILVRFKSKPFNITVIQVCVPTTDAEEDEVKQFYEDLQDLGELTPKNISFS